MAHARGRWLASQHPAISSLGTALMSNQSDRNMGGRWGTAVQDTSNKHLLRKREKEKKKRYFIRPTAHETPYIHLHIACYALSWQED